MRICNVTSVHNLDDSRIFHKIAKSCAKYGNESILVGQSETDRMEDNVRIIGIKPIKNRIIRFFSTSNLSKILDQINADVYHFHDPELIPMMLRFKRKRRHKVVIYDAHEYYKEVILSKSYIPSFLRIPISKLAWHYEKKACARLDGVITPTYEMTEIYSKHSKNIETIFNYDFKEGLNIKSEIKEFDIIHVGTLSINRFDFLLQIALSLKNMDKEYRWCIIGLNQSHYEHFNKNYANVLNHVTLIERIPFWKVKDFYSKSIIGINYHPDEKRFQVAIPLKIFEYMKYELIVVSSNLKPIREFILDEVNGSICYLNTPEDFAKHIIDNLNREDKNKVGKFNRDQIINKYNWENQEKTLFEFYDKLRRKINEKNHN